MPVKSKPRPRTNRPSSALIAAARAYFQAQALVETLRPVITGIKAALLTEMQIRVADKWIERGVEDGGPITDPARAYLMSAEDAARFFPELDARIRAAGFTEQPEGYCPLLVAEALQRDAANVVLDAAVSFHGQSALSSANLSVAHQDLREQTLDVTLRYVAQYV